MNGAITKGYEEDVGNKTSVYVHTAHSITTSLYLLKKYGYKSAPHDEVLKLQRQQCCIVLISLHRINISALLFLLTGYKICVDSRGDEGFPVAKGSSERRKGLCWPIPQ